MSTNNFKFENILIVLPDFHYDYKKPCRCCDDEDCEYSELDSQFDNEGFDEYITDIKIKLEKIGFETCDKNASDRNYNGTIIARYGLEDNTGMIVWLEVVIRSGYYSGINIDYTIDGDFGVIEGNKKSETHYHAMHRKLDKMVEKTKKILRKSGIEMSKVGQFSNGEAVYRKK